MMHLYIKSGQKLPFSHLTAACGLGGLVQKVQEELLRGRPVLVARAAIVHPYRKNATLVLSAFLMFVPSLSW